MKMSVNGGGEKSKMRSGLGLFLRDRRRTGEAVRYEGRLSIDSKRSAYLCRASMG